MTTATERFTLPTAAELQRQEDERGAYRPSAAKGDFAGRQPFTEFIADTLIEIVSVPVTKKDGTQIEIDRIRMTFANMSDIKVHRSEEPYFRASGEHWLDTSKYANTECGLTSKDAAAALDDPNVNLLALSGKRIHFVEEVQPAPRDKDGQVRRTRPNAEGQTYALKPVFWYSAKEIVGNDTKAAPPVAISDFTEAENQAILVDAVGKTLVEFMSGVMKLPEVAAMSGPKRAFVAQRKWLQAMIEAGRIESIDNVYHVNGLG